MQRFILQANIERFQRQLAGEADTQIRNTLLSLLAGARRDLALVEAVLYGSRTDLPPAFGPLRQVPSPQEATKMFQKALEGSQQLSLLLDPRPGLHIIELTDAYEAATMTRKAAIAGQKLFDVFPDNPANPAATGVVNLYASIQIAARSSQPHAMAIQRYDIRVADESFVERHWRPVNTPLLDEEGRVKYILHTVEDVTEMVSRARSMEKAKV